ncbi:unnamed protein product [Vitrella brassicaformis CCMP3155]|uniref:Apple domain-containing protein n=1 Tax=Vitrella brassicaformis (strain CCMP3155) TaxID=1169540 RepID=A0A0G4H797_VITBC|nr:unnamed protein product [Vitrella brassicaformis CCMP3155]|eukprot:CEM39615.1 unnamed protein product [Vitrella brassicaformis CCMP3155]
MGRSTGAAVLLLCCLIGRSDGQEPGESPPFNITMDELDTECWTWQRLLDGTFLEGADPLPLEEVWLVDQCAEKCDARDDCKAWSFDWLHRPPCSLMSGVSSGQWSSMREHNEQFIASGKRDTKDCRPIDARRPCFEHNIRLLWSGISYEYTDANLTMEECQAKCYVTRECRYFQYTKPNICYLKNRARWGNKVCSEGSTVGFFNGRECGQPSLLTPSDTDVSRLKAQGLLSSLQLLYESYPTFNVSQESYDMVNQCGCYWEGTVPFYEHDEDTNTTAEGSAVLLREHRVRLTAPRECQLLCQGEEGCEHFSTGSKICQLWKDVKEWVPKDDPHSDWGAGPALCPRDRLDEGLLCDSSFYRQRYTALSLFVLKVKDVRVPMGDSCPMEINWPSLGWIVAAAVIFLGCFIMASVSRAYYEKTTNVVSVMVAAIAMFDFLTDMAFVARSYDEKMLWVFWCGLLHLIIMMMFNTAALITMTRSAGKQGDYYRRWMASLEEHNRHYRTATAIIFFSSFLHLGTLHLFGSRLFGRTAFSLQVHQKSFLFFELLTLAEDLPQVTLQVSYVLLNSGSQGIPSVTLVSLLTSVFQILKIVLFGLKYALSTVFPSVALKSHMTHMDVESQRDPSIYMASNPSRSVSSAPSKASNGKEIDRDTDRQTERHERDQRLMGGWMDGWMGRL